jgi:plasmid replication initiation protein
MAMHNRKPIVWMSALALPLAGFFAAPARAGVPDSETVSKLLSETKTTAFQLKEDAGTMESFTRMKVSAESQAAAINQIKNHIDALRNQTAKLLEAKEEASPWQRAAIDRITPFLDELDGYTLAIIEHLNGQPKHNFAEYQDYLEANADYSADLAAMIADYVDYGKTKDRMQRLAEKLEIPKTH